MTSKEELNGALTNLLNNFLIGILSNHLISDDMWLKIKDEKPEFSSGNGKSIFANIDELCLALTNSEKKILAIEEFEKSLKRSLLRECHEIICLYCENTNQYEKYCSNSLYQFARILRNTISHKDAGRLRNWPSDLIKKDVFEIKWREKILSRSMIGNEIDFTHYDTLLFTMDQIDFVDQTLE